MDIKKINNVKFSLTDEVLTRKWNEVINRRNRLLSMSDWTQLPDVELSKDTRNMWVRWRQKIRNVRKSSIKDPEKAHEILNSLEAQIPEKINIPDVVSNEVTENVSELSKFKEELLPQLISPSDVEKIINDRIEANTKLIIDVFNNTINQKITKESEDSFNTKAELIEHLNKKYFYFYSLYTEVDNEKFKQAVDYLVDDAPNLDHYPLIKIESDHLGVGYKEMAKIIINRRSQWMDAIGNFEKERLACIKSIKSSVDEELPTMLEKINNIKIA